MASSPTPAVAEGETVSAWQTIMNVPDSFGGIKQAAKARQASQMKRTERNLAIAHKVDEAIRGRKTYEEVRDLVRKSGAVCTIRRQGDPLSKPKEAQNSDSSGSLDLRVSYRNQANLEMYTSQNMKIREENRHHPEVTKAIDAFWAIIPKTTNGNVNKSIYKWMNRKLFFTFVPQATEQEFERTVYEDWKNDACYSHMMNYRAFKNAFFALADVWCETVDPLEYRDFLLRCKKIVESGAEYKGRRDEERDPADVAAARRKTTVDPAAQLGRRQSRVSQLRSEVDEAREVHSPDEDSFEALKVGAELLEDEILQMSSLQLYRILTVVADLQRANAEDAEDNINHALRDLQDRRFDCFEDDKDEAFQFEANFLKEAREYITERENRQHIISEEQKVIGTNAFQDPQDIAKWRQKRLGRRQAFEDCVTEHMNLIRDSMLKDMPRFKEAYTQIAKLDRHLFEAMKGRLPNEFGALRSSYDIIIKDAQRVGEARTDIDDDQFNEFIIVTKDLMIFRNIAQLMTDRTPLLTIHEEFFGNDHPDIEDVKKPKWGNSRFKRGSEWLWSMFRDRGENIEDILETSREFLKRLGVKELKYLHGLHRVEMDAETAEIETIAKDPFTPSKEKLAVMGQLQEAKQVAKDRRAVESSTIQSRHQQWDLQINELAQANATRLKLENRVCGELDEAKSVEDAFIIAQELLELYAAPFGRDVMEATMAPGMERPIPDPVPTAFPPEVTGPIEMLSYLSEQSARWMVRWLIHFGTVRHGFVAERMTNYHQFELHQVQRLEEKLVNALTRSIDQVEKLKDVLGDPNLSKDYSEEQLGQIQDMLAQEAYLKKLKNSHDGVKAFRQDALVRYHNIGISRAQTRASRYVGVLATLNTILLQYGELVNARTQHEGQLVARFMNEWSDVEKQVKLAEAHAAERRKKAAERMRREQELLEQRRQQEEALRLKMLAEEEKEKLELDAAKRKREKDVLETRKRQLEERERREKERQKKEEEEKKRWRQEFAEEQKRRKKEDEERRQLEMLRMQRGGGGGGAGTPLPLANTGRKGPGGKPTTPVHTPKITSLTPPQPMIVTTPAEPGAIPSLDGAKKVVRRKSQQPPTAQYKGEIDTNLHPTAPGGKSARTAAGIKSTTAPSVRIRKTIEEEIKAFGLLNSASMALNLQNFSDRRSDYFLERASNAAVYALECSRLKCTISPQVSSLLSNVELGFTMTNLDVSGLTCNILSLLDVIALNPIQQLSMRKMKSMDKDAVKKLCQVLLKHEFIQVIDVRQNPEVGPHGGQSLLTCVKENPRIVRVKMDGCNIPPEIASEINTICEKHQFCNTIGRAEFAFIKSVFDEIDKDKSGFVDMTELRAYNEQHQALIGTKSMALSGPDSSSPGSPRSDDEGFSPNLSVAHSMMVDRQLRRVDMIRDVLLQIDQQSKGSFDLVDLLSFIYPTWLREDLEILVARYTDDSADGASIAEMEKFIETFGSNGTLTLHQLAKGLGEVDAEALRGAFQECDLDGDGVLSIDEFMSFVGA